MSEIRDMTNEESSNEEEEEVQGIMDYSNLFEIKQGIKWDKLVRPYNHNQFNRTFTNYKW